MDLSSKQRIVDFNQSDVVYTFKKLVSWRENGITFPVPESLRDYIKDPTDLKKYRHLLSLSIDRPFLPATTNLTEEMIETIEDMEKNLDDIESFSDDESGYEIEYFTPESFFWIAALSLNKADESFYTWETVFYKDVLDKYLSMLQDLVFVCEGLNKFETAKTFVPSLAFFKVPLRFSLRERGEFSHSNILVNYVQQNYPTLYGKIFLWEDDAKVSKIGELLVEQRYSNGFVKINTTIERKVLSKNSSLGERIFPFFWYLPEPICIFLDGKLKNQN